MSPDILAQILIAGVNQLGQLSAIYGKAKAEGNRDLTPEEIAVVRGNAFAANHKLQDAINAAAPKPDGGGGPGEEKVTPR